MTVSPSTRPPRRSRVNVAARAMGGAGVPAVAGVAFNRDATAPQLRPATEPGFRERRVERRSRRAALRVVAPTPRRRSIGMVVAGLCATIFVGLLGLTALQVTLAQNQQQLDTVNREVQQARDYYDRLRLAVSRLQSPEYVATAATQRLGMVAAVDPLYATPTPDVVASVAASTGETIADPGQEIGAGREEWGDVKAITEQAP